MKNLNLQIWESLMKDLSFVLIHAIITLVSESREQKYCTGEIKQEKKVKWWDNLEKQQKNVI